jgi:hypothetical protein
MEKKENRVKPSLKTTLFHDRTLIVCLIVKRSINLKGWFVEGLFYCMFKVDDIWLQND